MASTNVSTGRSGVGGGEGVGFRVYAAVYGGAGMLALAGVLALSACQREPAPAAMGREKTATIRVIDGNGRLAGGEEYEIAEWRSGTLAPGGGTFADFRGQDGGPTLDLSLKGLGAQGEYACGEALSASLELRVDVQNAYRAAPDAPCRVAVEHVGDGVIEGHYTATLRHTGNPADEMTVAGSFRATLPGEAAVADIKAAQGPKIGLR